MSNVIGLNEEHEANLRKLAAYLRQPKLMAEFDMSAFDSHHSSQRRNLTTCGSIGCAVGHGPYAGIQKYMGEEWGRYSERVFGLVVSNPNWMWCFDANWEVSDNSPVGAANRIETLLNTGLPKDWREQLDKGHYA